MMQVDGVFLWSRLLNPVVASCASREFTHRIKSMSMSSWTPDEVRALEEGGNEVSVTNVSTAGILPVLVIISVQELYELLLKD